MRRPTLPALTAAGIALLLTAGGVAATSLPTSTAATSEHHDGDLARDFSSVDRNTAWKLADTIHLDFPTFHTEGLAVTPDHLFLSAVEILEPTRKYPTPVGGYDRTPGKGVGHLFVMDRQGHLQKDIMLGEGDMYHPGGIDFDGTERLGPRRPVPARQQRDHLPRRRHDPGRPQAVRGRGPLRRHRAGRATGHLVGNTWGSRRFDEWDLPGQADSKPGSNPSFFIDYQDCQYVPTAKMICGGVTNLPQTPTAGGDRGDLRARRHGDDRPAQPTSVLREMPFQQWSSAGHVMTRNPFKLAADGNHLTMWAAPDNGEEGNGTEVFHYTATVTR